ACALLPFKCFVDSRTRQSDQAILVPFVGFGSISILSDGRLGSNFIIQYPSSFDLAAPLVILDDCRIHEQAFKAWTFAVLVRDGTGFPLKPLLVIADRLVTPDEFMPSRVRRVRRVVADVAVEVRVAGPEHDRVFVQPLAAPGVVPAPVVELVA